YVLSGWEGSAHDSKILNDAMSKYYLGDGGFANRRYCLTPFRGQRYHLKEFSGTGNHAKKAEELFNMRHASLRNVVERLFGVVKSRFLIFKSQPPFPYQVQAEIMTACAGLHNFLRKECRSDEFPVEEEEDSHPSTLVNDDEISTQQTQEQQRQEANAWRKSIADDMWENVREQRELE
ncbi:uncharacterized protein LOC113313656, partial [Papaver somniferum]|uniref:uncharacterized protein LOC113313656 n=1 Tax=Papaver somniferum TaxID=3469 RepID=UPI000E6F7A95